MVPEDVERALEGLLYHASYCDCTSGLHVHVTVPQDLDLWHYNTLDVQYCRPVVWRIIRLIQSPISAILTDDVELDDVTFLRVGRDLALVLAFVARLDVFHLQRPRVRLAENRLEPFVRNEHGSIHREDMRVSSSDPGDLRINQNELFLFALNDSLNSPHACEIFL